METQTGLPGRNAASSISSRLRWVETGPGPREKWESESGRPRAVSSCAAVSNFAASQLSTILSESQFLHLSDGLIIAGVNLLTYGTLGAVGQLELN